MAALDRDILRSEPNKMSLDGIVQFLRGLVSNTRSPAGAVIVGSPALLHVRDEQTSGTNGGTFTNGAWQTRTLNTEVTNEITGASLASNQITLPAGTYEIYARSPAHAVNQHKAKLYDTTNTADLILGSSQFSNSGGASDPDSIVMGRFTLSAQAVLELQHRCTTTAATNGFGVASSYSVVEVYAEAMIRKVG